jgi:hypothetical protein
MKLAVFDIDGTLTDDGSYGMRARHLGGTLSD